MVLPDRRIKVHNIICEFFDSGPYYHLGGAFVMRRRIYLVARGLGLRCVNDTIIEAILERLRPNA